MSEVGLLVLAEALVLIVGQDGPVAGVDVRARAGRGGVADRADRRRPRARPAQPGVWAIPIVLAVGALIGVVNALLIVRFKLNGFVVTLGMLITLRGLLTGISKGQTFFQLPASMTYLGRTRRSGSR